MNNYQHIYLSPHYDDISLSCGGSIHRQTQAGEAVLGITICAAAPTGKALSAFAGAMHQNWGNPADVVATRRAEDQLSMARLGADYRLLAWLDCIYREGPERGVWYYNSAPEIFGEVQPDDWPLAAEIAAALVELIPNKDTVTIYAPLTVGHHVDHQLTHKAAWQLREQGYSVAFYEDYPYVDPRYPFTHLGAGNTYNLAAALAALRPAQLNPQLHLISEENLRAKIDSIRAYSSQLPVLFGGEEAMAKYVREYALYVGEGNPAERIWTPAGRVGR